MSGDSIQTGNIKGDVLGANVSGSGHLFGKEITTIHGNVFQLVNPSIDVIERLSGIAAIKTEVRPSSWESGSSSSAESGSSASPRNLATIEQSLDEVLSALKTLQQQGKQTQEIKVGELNISHVDLLVKKAVLLQTEADQIIFDELERNKPKIEQAKAQANGSTFQLNIDEILVDFDWTKYTAKLKEAYNLLCEANTLDPINTEVLLHMAQTYSRLNPDDYGQVRKILYRALQLLSEPKDDVEKFRWAQATFLLGQAGQNTDFNLVSSARAMFERVGRVDWVGQCDSLLRPASTFPISQSSSQVSFQPVGQWHIQVTDGSIMLINFYPDGTLEGMQQVGLSGLKVQFVGRWVFIPQTHVLQMQALINGIQPSFLAITIQGAQNNGFYGIGIDGYGYFFTQF